MSDDLRIAILGARKHVLFIEGTSTSDDRALFSLLYPGWHIAPSGSWEQVVSYVRTIHSNSAMVWLEARGIVDGDGRDAHERGRLESDNVFCIDKPTIENLFCLSGVIEAVANAVSSFEANKGSDNMLDSMRNKLPSILSQERDKIARLQIVWKTNRVIAARKISRGDLDKGQNKIEEIEIDPISAEVYARIDEICKNPGLDTISNLPIKNTSIPSFVAYCLGFANFTRYKGVVIKQLELNTIYGQTIREEMLRYLPSLANIA